MRQYSWKTSAAVAMLALLGAGCSIVPMAGPPPDCITAEYIERLNRWTEANRLFELQGMDAKIFFALDPAWLADEDGYASLVRQDINKLIAWKIRDGLPLGAAVPFFNDCAVEKYGEPDFEGKLLLMYDGVVVISREGIDDPRARDIINKLLVDRYRSADERKLKAIVERIRSLLMRSGPHN